MQEINYNFENEKNHTQRTKHKQRLQHPSNKSEVFVFIELVALYRVEK